MVSGWRYRLAGVGGTILATFLVVVLLNQPVVARLWSTLPVVNRLAAEVAVSSELVLEAILAAVVMAVVCTPLYKPPPRRILDTIALTQRQVFIGFFALATIGYFDYTYRLPRSTLLGLGVILLVVLPAWFVWIRGSSGDGTWLLVGDDPDQMADLYAATDHDIVGYVSPPFVTSVRTTLRTNGGVLTLQPDQRLQVDKEIPRLGGLVNLEQVIVDSAVDTVLLAFDEADRGEFFGALDACYKHGVAAKVHREHADSVLTAHGEMGTFVEVDIEPWDVQDYLMKRLFDVGFSFIGIVLLLPVMTLIAVAIKSEDGGSILYRQERTAVFGETFEVVKFRSMVQGAESKSGAILSVEDIDVEDSRVTRVGRLLRPTHLDEIPQLWSVLKGDMSVVGPRPERPELEAHMELGTAEWRSRWFVKPGLTGLAQINNVTGYQSETKLRYDLEYIRRQSFWFDVKIVIRQIWKTGWEVITLITKPFDGHR